MTNFGLNNLAALLSHPLNYPIYIQLLTSSLHKFFFFFTFSHKSDSISRLYDQRMPSSCLLLNWQVFSTSFSV